MKWLNWNTNEIEMKYDLYPNSSHKLIFKIDFEGN